MTVPTPHIEAQVGEIASTVLLPGDPLRARFIAETYLTDVRLFNQVRGMLGFTGKYQGKPVSVMGSGMGIPSMAIYSMELIRFYQCRRLIRVGSCGAYQPQLDLYDLILAQGASTDSRYATHFGLEGTYAALADWQLLSQAADICRRNGYPHHIGGVKTGDVFYEPDPEGYKRWAAMGVLAAEMETYALYCNAAAEGVAALSILTVSDSFTSGKSTSSAERETAFKRMIDVALELV